MYDTSRFTSMYDTSRFTSMYCDDALRVPWIQSLHFVKAVVRVGLVILILTPLDRQLLNCPTLAEALRIEAGIYATQAFLTVFKHYLSGNPFIYSMTVGLMTRYSTEKIIITPLVLFVVVGYLQRCNRQFAGHRVLTPRSRLSSDAFENSWLSNPNKDTKRTRSLYSTPFGGFRCQLPGCRTCSNWHWELIWPVSHVIPGLPNKLWIVLRVIPATNKNNNLDWKIQGNFFLPESYLS